MIRILIFNDVHLADKPPLGRKDDYAQSILTKLEEIRDLCKTHEVAAAICTGDLFHVKRPDRVSHQLVRQVGNLLQSFTLPVYIVPGNHDMGPDELVSLERQPLGVLASWGAVTLLAERSLFVGPLHLIPRPWNTERDADPTYYSPTTEELSTTNQHILVAHGSLLPPGEERPYPYVTIDQVPGIEHYAVVFAGHIHEPLGIVPVKGGPLYVNLGSVGRTARTQSNLLRRPEVALLEAEGQEVTVTRLTLTSPAPIDEVFEAKATATEDTPDEIVRLANVLAQGLSVEQVSLDDLLSRTPIEMSEPVRRLVKGYLEMFL